MKNMLKKILYVLLFVLGFNAIATLFIPDEAFVVYGVFFAILFIAGGPGGSQIQATREKLSALENDYTIVNWEQPGAGKSYNAHPINSLTPDVYVEDGHALTQYLKERFNQQKIYLIGESWESYLGIRLSKEYPEDYHAFIGTGQMVDFSETEQYCYDLALSIANKRNDLQQIKALENLDEIPIRGKNISLEIGT